MWADRLTGVNGAWAPGADGPRYNGRDLVIQVVQGQIAHPVGRANPYRIGHDGRPRVLPGTGGIVVNRRIGDRCVGLAGDHIEPGVALHNNGREIIGPRDGPNMALLTSACVGNLARVVSGPCTGTVGLVTGKHGGVNHVLVDFPTATLLRLNIGDRVQIYSIGPGLRLLDHPTITVSNASPGLLRRWGLREWGVRERGLGPSGVGEETTGSRGARRPGTGISGTGMLGRSIARTEMPVPRLRGAGVRSAGRADGDWSGGRGSAGLEVPVTHILPASLIGSGLGKNSSWRGDFDIQLADPVMRKRYNLEALRFGDLVAIQNEDTRFGPSWRRGRVTIGVVVHGDSTVSGHGPGVTALLTGPAQVLRPILDQQANIAGLYGRTRPSWPRRYVPLAMDRTITGEITRNAALVS